MAARILAAAGVALLAAAVTLPAVGGRRAEQVHARAHAEARRYLPLALTQTSYERGWLRSRARTVFTLSAQPDASPPAIVVRDEIHHGPLPVLAWLGGEAASPGLAWVRSEIVWQGGAGDAAGEMVLARVRTSVRLDGSAHAWIEAPTARSGGTGGEAGVAFGGASGWLEASADLLRLRGALRTPGLTVAASEGRLALKDAALDLEWSLGASGLPVGETRLTLRTLESQRRPGEPGFTAAGITLRQVQREEAGLVSSVLDVAAERVASEKGVLGPARLSSALERLDAQALVQLTAAAGAAPDPADPDAAAALQATVFAALPALLAQGPQARVDLVLETGPGSAEAHVEAGLDAERMAMGGPLAAMGAAWATGSASAPQTLVEGWLARAGSDAPVPGPAPSGRERAERLVARGLLERAEDRYVLRVTFRDGRLRLNGREVDPGELRPGGPAGPTVAARTHRFASRRARRAGPAEHAGVRPAAPASPPRPRARRAM